MKKYAWFVLAVIALTALLVPLLSDIAREVLLVAILRFAWRMDRVVDSLPHAPFWLAFLFVAALVAALSVLPRPDRAQRPANSARPARGQVADLALLIRRAGRRPYFRRRLVQRLSHLGRQVYAHTHGIGLPEVARGPVPTAVDPLLASPSLRGTRRQEQREAAADSRHLDAPLQQALARLRAEPRIAGAVPDPAVELFVQFLEEQLEVDHARFNQSRR